MFGSDYMQLTPHQGPTETILAGSNRDLQRNFVPPDSHRGLRNMIAGFEIKVLANIDTGGPGSTIQGEDLCKGMANLLIEDAAGVLVNCSGEELRAFMYAAYTGGASLGRDTEADVATTAAATPSYKFCHYFAQPKFYRPKDGGLPVDTWLDPGFKFKVTAGVTADFDAASNYTINASTGFSVTLTVYTYEQFSYEDPIRWVLDTQATANDAEFDISGVGGLPLYEIFMHKTGASAGASLANITNMTALKLGMGLTEDEYIERLHYDWLSTSTAATNKNPFDHVRSTDAAGAKAFPIVWSPRQTKISQMNVVSGDPHIKVGGTAITNKKLVRAYLTPRSRVHSQKNARLRGINPATLVPKSPTGKALDVSDPFAPFLPLKSSGAVQRR